MTHRTAFATAPPWRHVMLSIAALIATGSTAARASDPGKAACLPDAKQLCSAEMHSLSRAKVRACLIAHIDQTGPVCHDFMIKARAAALSGHKPDSPTQ